MCSVTLPPSINTGQMRTECPDQGTLLYLAKKASKVINLLKLILDISRAEFYGNPFLSPKKINNPAHFLNSYQVNCDLIILRK